MSGGERLSRAGGERILIKDGPFGTGIQNRKLGAADYAGTLGLQRDQKGNNDILALGRPAVVEEITRAYLEAGADIIATNSFSANSISQADYGAESLVAEINIASARIACKAADDFEAKDGKARLVARTVAHTS